MNPIYSQQARQVQTVRCCGRIYKRWRFVGKRHFGRGGRPTHASHCPRCGQRLTWPTNFEPDKTAAVRREERVAGYYDQRVNQRLAGLTARGQPFRRTPNFLTAEERLAARRERGLKAWRKRSEKLTRAGLTTRGTVRVYGLKGAVEKMWMEFRSGIAMPVAANWELPDKTVRYE